MVDKNLHGEVSKDNRRGRYTNSLSEEFVREHNERLAAHTKRIQANLKRMKDRRFKLMKDEK